MDNKETTTKEQILLAAETEFMLNGYDGAKMLNIAKRAGVNHALLHYYYSTKQNLFHEVLNRKTELLAKSFIDAFKGNRELPLIERIESGFFAHFDFLRANPLLPQFIISQVIANADNLSYFSSFVRHHGKNIVDMLQKELDLNVEKGHFKHVRAIDLLYDALSLNILPFLTRPLLTECEGILFEEPYEQFLINRKKELSTVIRSRLLK